ncbi:MBL fold metallo-hydrolase [uncultured Bacteroides sp.]|uniref:MBL fold metallo-hydrolase n=1 Tax=uncultured Bacteroides sp. TaxID=162156 RepID=UPI002607829A|nr:MBL fold metallo-hydrolase [uncultured Bacteroides sp.]
MELIYLHHSGFVILTNNAAIVIDYFEDSLSENTGILHDKVLQRDCKIYVLSSHFHSDHFNKQILEWKNTNDNITYILSNDIHRKRRIVKDMAIWLKKGEEYNDNIIKVKAYGSTDVGISFLIETEGKTIFHAGDLNNWHWMDESPEIEWRRDEKRFLKEVETISKDYRNIDLVLFPIDPRLGHEYMRGGKQFIDLIKTSVFIPMHFWNDFTSANRFQQYVISQGIKSPEINHKGQILHNIL